ncbi:hypothetical protein [Mycobacterium sp. OTB74]|uniref:SecDF P1 head subdomain-containing protein n=1 Tax=Mycobacterium sp. OTB74 TaxID=1853452 RepID=UPI002473AF3F|nr:hypothetical protein [Mycobacterium sp. OTB74]MDH6244841.1 preprotein translocase subunit SecD [Mycobacterium sp. OTB74]
MTDYSPDESQAVPPAPGESTPSEPATFPGYQVGGYPPPGAGWAPPQNQWNASTFAPPEVDAAHSQRTVRTWVSIILAVVVLAYGAAVLLTKDAWSSGEPRSTTRAEFTVRALAGGSITPDLLAQTHDGLQSRINHLGGRDTTVTAGGDHLTVQTSGVSEAQLRGISGVGRLDIRPVIHTIAARPGAVRSRPAQPVADAAKLVAAEKQLRQSANPQIQLLALQFQATRCDQTDPLAGSDDPILPLVTCSKDHKQVYLLAKSIVGAGQIKSASSHLDQQQGQYVIDLQFNDKAAATWAAFTAANVGVQTAFTLDAQVTSAPVIRESMPDGHVQIIGNFTGDEARSLAATLASEPLPLAVDLQSTQVEPLKPKFWTVPRIAVACGGIVVLLTVIAGLLVMRPPARR